MALFELDAAGTISTEAFARAIGEDGGRGEGVRRRLSTVHAGKGAGAGAGEVGLDM